MTGLTEAVVALGLLAVLFAILRRATRPTPDVAPDPAPRATPAGTRWTGRRVVGTTLLVWVTWFVLVPLIGVVLLVALFLVWPR